MSDIMCSFGVNREPFAFFVEDMNLLHFLVSFTFLVRIQILAVRFAIDVNVLILRKLSNPRLYKLNHP
jgi:hypothetical protein